MSLFDTHPDIFAMNGWWKQYNQAIGAGMKNDSLHDFFGLKSYGGPMFKKDVAYDGNEIKATRMFWTIGKHWDYTEFIDFYHKLENDIEKLHTHGFTFHLYNQWMAMIEANEDVIKQTFMMLYISVPIIVAIVFGILQNVQATIYVMLMILLVDIDMLGVLYWLGIQFDTWVGLCVLIALGITVDFNVHLIHRAMELVPDNDIQDEWERNVAHTKAVLYSVGSSVFHGTFSTLLCVFPVSFLSISKSCSDLFLNISIIIIMGMYHGLIILPCILTIYPIRGHHIPQEARYYPLSWKPDDVE